MVGWYSKNNFISLFNMPFQVKAFCTWNLHLPATTLCLILLIRIRMVRFKLLTIWSLRYWYYFEESIQLKNLSEALRIILYYPLTFEGWFKLYNFSLIPNFIIQGHQWPFVSIYFHCIAWFYFYFLIMISLLAPNFFNIFSMHLNLFFHM